MAAPIVGLLLAGATVFETLEKFISRYTGAPALAQEVYVEVRDFRYALRRLCSYVEGSADYPARSGLHRCWSLISHTRILHGYVLTAGANC